MKYFLDTNILSYIVKGKYPNILEHMKKVPAQCICIPSVVKAEIEFGARKSDNYDKLMMTYMRLLEPFDIKDFDSDASYWYGIIRERLSKNGIIIGPNDLMIASIVRANNGTLITHNTDEFKRIEELRLEDWTI